MMKTYNLDFNYGEYALIRRNAKLNNFKPVEFDQFRKEEKNNILGSQIVIPSRSKGLRSQIHTLRNNGLKFQSGISSNMV